MVAIFATATAQLTPDFVERFEPKQLASTFVKVEKEYGVKFNKTKSTFNIVGHWEAVRNAHKGLIKLLEFLKQPKLAPVKTDKYVSVEELENNSVVEEDGTDNQDPIPEQTVEKIKGNPKRGRYAADAGKPSHVPEPVIYFQYLDKAFTTEDGVNIDCVLEDYENSQIEKKVTKADLKKVFDKNTEAMGRVLPKIVSLPVTHSQPYSSLGTKTITNSQSATVDTEHINSPDKEKEMAPQNSMVKHMIQQSHAFTNTIEAAWASASQTNLYPVSDIPSFIPITNTSTASTALYGSNNGNTPTFAFSSENVYSMTNVQDTVASRTIRSGIPHTVEVINNILQQPGITANNIVLNPVAGLIQGFNHTTNMSDSPSNLPFPYENIGSVATSDVCTTVPSYTTVNNLRINTNISSPINDVTSSLVFSNPVTLSVAEHQSNSFLTSTQPSAITIDALLDDSSSNSEPIKSPSSTINISYLPDYTDSAKATTKLTPTCTGTSGHAFNTSSPSGEVSTTITSDTAVWNDTNGNINTHSVLEPSETTQVNDGTILDIMGNLVERAHTLKNRKVQYKEMSSYDDCEHNRPVSTQPGGNKYTDLSSSVKQVRDDSVDTEPGNIGDDVDTYEAMEDDSQTTTDITQPLNTDSTSTGQHFVQDTLVTLATNAADTDSSVLSHNTEEADIPLNQDEPKQSPTEPSIQDDPVVRPAGHKSQPHRKSRRVDGNKREKTTNKRKKSVAVTSTVTNHTTIDRRGGRSNSRTKTRHKVGGKSATEIESNEERNGEEDANLSTKKLTHEQKKARKTVKQTKTKSAVEKKIDDKSKSSDKVEENSAEPLVHTKGKDKKVEHVFKCTKCDYQGCKKKRLTEHMGRVHGLLTTNCRGTQEKTTFPCDKCDKKFVFGKDLNRHKKIVHHGQTHFCVKCNKSYKSSYVFNKHMSSHEDGYVKPMFTCQICERQFTTKFSLGNHIKSEHLGLKKTYTCPTCGKTFSQIRSYRQHANVHAGIRPYVCEICQKTFTYDKSLKEHRYMHDNVRRFQCTVCDKAFRQRTCLLIHMKTHKESKDHICSSCGKGFTQKQSLLRHERIHSGDRPYWCKLCYKSFSDYAIIRKHMLMTHKKDRLDWKEDVFTEVKQTSNHYIAGGPGYVPRDKSSRIREKNFATVIPPDVPGGATTITDHGCGVKEDTPPIVERLASQHGSSKIIENGLVDKKDASENSKVFKTLPGLHTYGMADDSKQIMKPSEISLNTRHTQHVSDSQLGMEFTDLKTLQPHQILNLVNVPITYSLTSANNYLSSNHSVTVANSGQHLETNSMKHPTVFVPSSSDIYTSQVNSLQLASSHLSSRGQGHSTLRGQGHSPLNVSPSVASVTRSSEQSVFDPVRGQTNLTFSVPPMVAMTTDPAVTSTTVVGSWGYPVTYTTYDTTPAAVETSQSN